MYLMFKGQVEFKDVIKLVMTKKRVKLMIRKMPNQSAAESRSAQLSSNRRDKYMPVFIKLIFHPLFNIPVRIGVPPGHGSMPKEVNKQLNTASCLLIRIGWRCGPMIGSELQFFNLFLKFDKQPLWKLLHQIIVIDYADVDLQRIHNQAPVPVRQFIA